jgi:serine/threonine-protein kinase
MDETRGASAPAARTSAQEADPLIGRLINERYKVVGVIARGGMGKVYRAEQAPLGRLVALKVLSPSYNGESDPEFHRRFFLEASIASKLSHPNTVTIFDYGKTDDEIFYIAMELLEGRTLQRALRDEGPFSPDRAMQIARQICRSLREAHGLGVIHRDLKPANVFLVKHGDENEFVKVLDFGLVKDLEEQGEQLTKTGLFMGSPKYMSPEQIRGEKVDSRVDVYALGVMMYEMLSGKVPFDRPNSVNILMAHIHEQVPAMQELNAQVNIPPPLEMIVRKCMAKHPDDRFSSMNDVLIALKGLGGDPNVSMSGEHRVPQYTESGLRSPNSSMTDVSSGFSPVGNSSAPHAREVTQTQQIGPFAQASKPSSSGAPLFLAAIFALTGVGGFVVLSHNFNDEDAAAAAAPVEPVKGTETPQESPASEASTEKKKPRKVVLTLRSSPPGAMVLVGDKEYGPTPTHVVWTGEDAAEGREVTFRFHRRGYLDVTVTQAITGDRLEVEAPPMEPSLARRQSRKQAVTPPASDPQQ